MLLHADSYVENFGLHFSVEPIQLSSILYAIYSLGHELEDEHQAHMEDVDTLSGDLITNMRRAPVQYFRQVVTSIAVHAGL